MRYVKDELLSTVVVVTTMITGAIASYYNNILAAFVISIGALFGYVYMWFRKKNMFDFLGLMFLGFVLPMGIGNFRLAEYQDKWEVETWICFILAVFCYSIGYTLCKILFHRKEEKKCISRNDWEIENLFKFGIVVFIFVVFAFCIKWWVAGSIPLFNWTDAHTYVRFLSGEGYLETLQEKMQELPYLYLIIKFLHRFLTIFMFQGWLVSCALYGYCKKAAPNRIKKIVSMLVIITCLVMPILIVVREIFMMQTVAFAVYAYIINNNKIKKYLYVVALMFVTLIGFAFMSKSRGFSQADLETVFEMKQDDKQNVDTQINNESEQPQEKAKEEVDTKHYPATLIWTYTYFTGSYDNFNHLTKTLDFKTYGLLQIRPILSAFNIKNLKDIDEKITLNPKYFVSPNINVFTFLMDAYVDFGVLGVACSMFIWGMLFFSISLFALDYQGVASEIVYGGIGHHISFMCFVPWMDHFSYLCSFGLLFIYYLISLRGRQWRTRE